MAEYDDRDDYGEGNQDYSDPSDYQDFKWNSGYDEDEIDDLIKDYNSKINDLNQEWSKKRSDNTRKQVEMEIQKLQNIKSFLENLRAYSRKWNPTPDTITKTKVQIGILEKELRDTNSSLRRCKNPQSILDRQEKINRISKTLTIYKKSFSLIKNKNRSGGFGRPPSGVERHSTKPVPTEKRIPLPKEKNWSATGEAADAIKSVFSWGWWGAKGVAQGTAVTARGTVAATRAVAGASVAVGNLAIEGGESLYSTFRNNPESQEKVQNQHQEIDRETEQKNENVVKRVEQIKVFPNEESKNPNDPARNLKTQVINLGIEKNNLEGEKRKEEVKRQEHEKLCAEEESRRKLEEQKRISEENLRKKNSELFKKLTDLGKGVSENEKIRVEEEDIRQEQENTRQLNENERQMKEDTRQTFENLRQEDEKIRQTLDNNRKIYWEEMLKQKEEWLEKISSNNDLFKKLLQTVDADEQRRQRLDASINENEDKRLGNEAIRLENEQDRRDAENQRIANEKARIEAEKSRVDAELKRVTGETKREENEQNRIDEEEKRFVNEDQRIADEKARNTQEKIRIASEKERIDNEKRRQNLYSKLEKIPESESKRVEAEKGRKEREKLFQENELKRVAGENERIKNEERRKFIQEQNLKLLEDRKNKLDEIEMKFKKRGKLPPEEKNPKKSFETYFTNKENTTEWIEDKKFKEKVNKILENINDLEEQPPKTYSNALLDGIQEMENINLTAEWEKKIFVEEKEKLKWRQRINILNMAFLDKNIVLTDNDPNIIDFLRKNLKDSETIKTKELNGFFYEDKKIVKRNVKKQFVPIEGDHLNNFLEELKKLNVTAETIISNEVGLFADSETNKEFAESYIRELREEQKQLIRNGTMEDGEFFEMEEFNAIGRDIEDIQRNRRFKIRPKIWARSFGGFVSRFVKYLKILFGRHGFKICLGLFITAIGSSSSFLIFRDFLNRMGHKIKDFEKNFPDNVKEFLKNDISEFFKHYLGNYWGIYLSSFLAILGIFARKLILGFTKSVVFLSADIIGGMGKMAYAILTAMGLFGIYPLHKAMDFLAYKAYELYEQTFYMRDQIPPENVLRRRAEDEKMSIQEYKEKFISPNHFYNSYIYRTASYPLSLVSYSAGVAADTANDGMEWIMHWGIVAGILLTMFFFAYILIKWRK